MENVSKVWNENAAKYQVQMRSVDKDGVPTGAVYPQFHAHPKSADIKSWLLATGFYLTPPGSGNIYSRRLLDRIFPLKDIGTPCSDSYCIAAAPLFGDVVTIPRPLVSYRIHGANACATTELDPSRLTREVSRALRVFNYTKDLASRVGLSLSTEAPWNSLWLLPYRIGSWKLNRGTHPVPRDSFAVLVADAGRALLTGQGLRLRARMLSAAWCLAVLAAPVAIARHLILWRFAPTARPQVLAGLLRRTGVVR